jgi:hypothetical protein
VLIHFWSGKRDDSDMQDEWKGKEESLRHVNNQMFLQREFPALDWALLSVRH